MECDTLASPCPTERRPSVFTGDASHRLDDYSIPAYCNSQHHFSGEDQLVPDSSCLTELKTQSIFSNIRDLDHRPTTDWRHGSAPVVPEAREGPVCVKGIALVLF